MKFRMFFLALVGFSFPLFADPLQCKLSDYHAAEGLHATVERGSLVITWTGDSNSDVRSRFGIDRGQPIIQELAVRKDSGSWIVLGRNLVPEIQVTSGRRRISSQQLAPLTQELKLPITPELIEREKWQAFWDAPLLVPGTSPRARPTAPGEAADRNPDLPRKPEEIRRANAAFETNTCTVKTDGARLEVTFPGLSMGIFAGSLRFTVYRGTGLIRMEAVAKTDEPSVAYKYEAGLRGFSTSLTPKVVWHDTGGDVLQYRFGGERNDARVGLKARNRILVAEGNGASVATFPPPHTFFFAREVETNLGYVWYRKDSANGFGIGVRQPDREEVEEYAQNFALYNAPPGTWQRMAVYFYIAPSAAEPTREAVLAFTHGDRFRAVPGYKVLVNHMHTRFTEQLRANGSLDGFTQELSALKALGVNIVGLSDFHDDLHKYDPGALRLQDQHDYALGSARASDRDFLVLPWEEVDTFGGHQNIFFPHMVYWTVVRNPGQPFSENLAGYGKVYHVGNSDDLQRILDAEHGYWNYAHQRTKGSTGYPDATLNAPFVNNDRNIGLSFKPGMGMDLSDPRLCSWRCFDALDLLNNHIANSGLEPKYLIADIDTYRKAPEDDLYPQFPVTYVKLDRVPAPADDWSPVLQALRDGNSFGTTGEILIPNYSWTGAGNNKRLVADVEWTFPLEFLELVWGDGTKVEHQIISATDLLPFGKKRFELPFDAAGKSWIRFAVWDSAGNGAFLQPVWVTSIK